jgi:hypothetical protein
MEKNGGPTAYVTDVFSFSLSSSESITFLEFSVTYEFTSAQLKLVHFSFSTVVSHQQPVCYMCIAGYAVSRVLHRIQSEIYFETLARTWNA